MEMDKEANDTSLIQLDPQKLSVMSVHEKLDFVISNLLTLSVSFSSLKNETSEDVTQLKTENNTLKLCVSSVEGKNISLKVTWKI